MSWKTRYHLQERRKKGGKKAFKITKSDLVTAPNIHTSSSHFGSIPYSTGHGSKKTHTIFFSTGLNAVQRLFFLYFFEKSSYLKTAHLAWEIALGPFPFKSYLLYTLDPRAPWDYSQMERGWESRTRGGKWGHAYFQINVLASFSVLCQTRPVLSPQQKPLMFRRYS